MNFIAGGKMNAFAGNKDGLDCIGLNVGAAKLLERLFDSMLCDPECIPEIGDPSLVGRHAGYNPEVVEWSPAEEKSARPYQPNCPVRAKYASSLTTAGVYFLFFHELGHVFNGHLDWLKATTDFDALDENNASSIYGLSNLDYQTLEMDADCFAIQALLFWCLRLKTDPVTEKFVSPPDFGLGSSLDIFQICCFATYSFFRMFSDEEIVDEESILQKKHPPAAFRQQYVMATLFEIAKKYGIVSEDELQTVVKRVVSEVERSFYRMTDRKPFVIANWDKTFALSATVLAKLHANWKTLRPHLDTVKRGGNLAP